MFQKVYDNLGTDGRFVAYTTNPAFNLSHSNFTKYGFTIKNEILQEDRYEFHAEFVTDPPTPVTAYRWNQPTYEWATQGSRIPGVRLASFRTVSGRLGAIRERLLAGLVRQLLVHRARVQKVIPWSTPLLITFTADDTTDAHGTASAPGSYDRLLNWPDIRFAYPAHQMRNWS